MVRFGLEDIPNSPQFQSLSGYFSINSSVRFRLDDILYFSDHQFLFGYFSNKYVRMFLDD